MDKMNVLLAACINIDIDLIAYLSNEIFDTYQSTKLVITAKTKLQRFLKLHVAKINIIFI